MTGAARIRRNPEVVARELRGGEGALLLHRASGSYHRVNRIGALVWSALEEPASLDELGARIRARLREPPADLERDLARYVEELAGRELVLSETPGA